MVTPQQGSRRKPAKLPTAAQRLRWETDEQRRERALPVRHGEGYKACEDVMQEQGVSKILAVNLNDMAKELKIK